MWNSNFHMIGSQCIEFIWHFTGCCGSRYWKPNNDIARDAYCESLPHMVLVKLSIPLPYSHTVKAEISP